MAFHDDGILRLPPGCYVGPLCRDRAEAITASEEQRFFAPASADTVSLSPPPPQPITWHPAPEPVPEASLQPVNGALLRAQTATQRRKHDMTKQEPVLQPYRSQHQHQQQYQYQHHQQQMLQQQQQQHLHQHQSHALSSVSSWGGTFPFQPTPDVTAAVQRHMNIIKERFAPEDVAPSTDVASSAGVPCVEQEQPKRTMEYSPGDLSGAETGLDCLLGCTAELQRSLAESANSLRIDLARVCARMRTPDESLSPQPPEHREPPEPPPPRRPPPYDGSFVPQRPQAAIWRPASETNNNSAGRQAAASAWAAAFDVALEKVEYFPSVSGAPGQADSPSRSGSEESLPDRNMINAVDEPPMPQSTHSTAAPVVRILDPSAAPADDVFQCAGTVSTLSESTPFLLGDYGLL